ncbi:MAG: crossover junction endodeoxyribonuclease RuvC [Candidatus Omnitrophica bacterium]|nr:crossover junction endodeoxyribonuclease RuvC [Candidatus Omnitrophota bacterium]MBI5144071.1 crossover junction endodeoxyribonuclease RuvC [Candidatus Omnitrophota bacterium]
MRILGIDPGLNITGYGIIDGKTLKLIEAGIIKTVPKTPIKDRLKKIYDSVSEIILEYKPSVLVLEKIYSHYKHPATAILMGHARAAVCLACGMHNLELINYPSTRIKKAITGNGHASKYQIQRMVQNFLNLDKPPVPIDISDALAVAISYCFIERRMGPR